MSLGSPFKQDDHGIELPKNPQVLLFHKIVRTFFWLFSSSVIIFLIISIGIPLIMGMAHMGGKYLDYLRTVTDDERAMYRRHAVVVSSGYNHVDAADRFVEQFLKRKDCEDNPALFSDSVKTEKKTDVREVNSATDELQKYVDDPFWLIMREILVVWVARMSVIVACAIPFAFIAGAAFFLGEGRSRLGQTWGEQLMPERAAWSLRALSFFPPLILTLAILPIAMPTLVIIPALLAATCICIFLLRRNFPEF